ncbi:VWA domain-containing protein [Flavobacterium amnicola]|uniref:VWA domain-containing protein n=1 Tax=Flavobacterium amnicola TaxID=2506422 RepID=A0A4Q1K2J7_9FLAO|nr:VWA domain-containing protein [Flavobacterium amnicola]RXR19004.1 VWA domain-containing protein [Flavobacterium amnicola]
MSINTILLLLLALIVAAGIAFYQYLYTRAQGANWRSKANYKSKLHLFLAFLRFAAIFLILVLLINPIISRKTYETQKTPLPIVVDNSESISFLNQDKKAKELAELIAQNKDLQEKYAVKQFSFDQDFYSDKELDFKGNQSNIYKVFENIKQLYRSQKHPIVLVTDGNQTQGNDYVYNIQQNASVFPIVVGDTIEHLDLKISQLNANKYAFLKNKFPVEVFLNYSGNKPVNATLSIQSGNTTLVKQNISFSTQKRSQSISVLLPAERVGVYQYRAVISSAENEKNKYNNVKNFAVEVIDQRTEIALVSSILHPDLGALKRSIESNVQRKITTLKPNEIKSLQNYNVLIFYQPNASFKSLLEQNRNAKLNTFVITGLNTDFNLLNLSQDDFEFKMSSQKEDYSANFNAQFNSFSIDNLGFEQFPPLENPFGSIIQKGNANHLLQARIRSITTENPLLTFTEKGISRNAYLFGENIWKWRMESYLKDKSFEKFDVFLDKIIQYLASNAKKKNLIVNHENFYNSGETISISAEYFNKNYEFDENAQLTIQLKNKNTNTFKVYDFLKGSNDYQVAFQDLEAGQYSFTVKEKTSNSQYSGVFQVLDFDAEKQFVNADWSRLKQLAENTQGKAYFPSEAQQLVDFLKQNDAYKPIQKEVVSKSPLIDWIWGLIFLAVLFTIEWFVRKYNGLL